MRTGLASAIRSIRAAIRRALQLAVSILYGARIDSSDQNLTRANASPRRILILNCSHVGDVIISTSILPILRKAYPSAEIGFVTASWSAMPLQNHPDVKYLHSVDHWWTNRIAEPMLKKIWRYRASRRKALKEIQDVPYDMALCIYPYFIPDLMDLVWDAGIPVRVGFSRSLYASLATHLADAPVGNFVHQSTIQAAILRPLGMDVSLLQYLKPSLPRPSPDGVAELLAFLEVQTIEEAHFSMIHMGSGAQIRELPPDFWRQVAIEISPHQRVLFTGKGQREEANAAQAMAAIPNCINACNRLSWKGFFAAVAYAKVLFGVESMAGHLAAAVGTPCVVAYTGTAGVGRWRPMGDNVTVVTHHLPCAPCNKSGGCREMTCLRSITPGELLDAERQEQSLISLGSSNRSER